VAVILGGWRREGVEIGARTPHGLSVPRGEVTLASGVKKLELSMGL